MFGLVQRTFSESVEACLIVRAFVAHLRGVSVRLGLEEPSEKFHYRKVFCNHSTVYRMFIRFAELVVRVPHTNNLVVQ